jgi:hypothetical protein
VVLRRRILGVSEGWRRSQRLKSVWGVPFWMVYVDICRGGSWELKKKKLK